MKLRIADNLTLPLEFVTSTQAILAKRRVGKSYTASVQAEEMLKANQQVVVIDPTGAWWGLKSSADGKSAGFPIAIFGGEHADVPLEESAGEIIASAIVADRFSAVLDLSLFRKGQLHRFMAAFAETLYRLNREAMHLFVDEADAVAPQKPFGEEARTLGAMQDIVRRGGIRGIGCTLITQRSAVLNKDVLTQCEVLTALRIVHPRDLDAVMEWVNVHGDPKLAAQMLESLPSLPVGTAWVWSPGFDIFKRVEIRKRATFDSGATPKPGQSIKPPKVLASVDVQKLGKQISATVERAKENDPRALRATIADLRKQLDAKPVETKTIEKKIITDKQIGRFESIATRLEREGQRRIDAAVSLGSAIAELKQTGADLLKTASEFVPALKAATNAPVPQAANVPVITRQVDRIQPTQRAVPTGDIDKVETQLLQKLADRSPVPTTMSHLYALAGYSVKSSNYPKKGEGLIALGFINQVEGGLVITQSGRDAIGSYEAAPSTGDSALQHWLKKLPKYESSMLDALAKAHPSELTGEEISVQINKSLTSSAFPKAIRNLKGLSFITGDNPYCAAEMFFEKAAR